MAIEIKEVPIEAYNSIGLVERYHVPLRHLYKIISNELKDKQVNKEIILQMAVKTVNNLVGPNRLVLILLVFGVYPQLIEMNPPSPLIIKRVEAIRTTMKEVQRIHIER